MEEQIDDNWTTLGAAVVDAIRGMSEALQQDAERAHEAPEERK